MMSAEEAPPTIAITNNFNKITTKLAAPPTIGTMPSVHTSRKVERSMISIIDEASTLNKSLHQKKSS